MLLGWIVPRKAVILRGTLVKFERMHAGLKRQEENFLDPTSFISIYLLFSCTHLGTTQSQKLVDRMTKLIKWHNNLDG